MTDNQITYSISLLSLVLGSSVIVAFIKNSQLNKRKHKEMVAEASKSVLKRVEMYYRIRRRTTSKEDVVVIRNLFHQIQEENEYYKTLLMSESKWHGERYVMYINAIQGITGDHIRRAWKEKPFGPDAEVKHAERPNHTRINELASQFAKDCRRLMNPITRTWMRVRDSSIVTKLWRIRVYDVQ